MFEGLPDRTYKTIAVDPPWAYGDSLPGNGRGAAKHYQTLTPLELTALPVGDLATSSAHLYLWSTNAFMEHAFALVRAWGFEPKTVVTWVKLKKTAGDVSGAGWVDETDAVLGMGHYWRGATEHVIFATRGKLSGRAHDLSTVIFAPRGAHSAKPDVFYERAARMSPGPRLDMFARARRTGWDAWGDEAEEVA